MVRSDFELGCLYRLCHISWIISFLFLFLYSFSGLAWPHLTWPSFSLFWESQLSLCCYEKVSFLSSAMLQPVYLQNWRAGNLVRVQVLPGLSAGGNSLRFQGEGQKMLPASIMETCKFHEEQWPTVGSILNIEKKKFYLIRILFEIREECGGGEPGDGEQKEKEATKQYRHTHNLFHCFA